MACRNVLKSMIDYHHTVLDTATPFGDFPKWCEESQTYGVSDDANEEVQKARRETLSVYIRKHFGSINAFANALERKQPQLNETLNGDRSFGEKLARSLEGEVDGLRKTPKWKDLPPLRFEMGETHPKLAALIAYFEAIPTEQDKDELIDIAKLKAQKSGNEAASTQVGRDSPVRVLGALHPGPGATPKKRRRA